MGIEGTIIQLVESVPTRLMVRIRLSDGSDDLHHLGKMILKDKAGAMKKAGRSRSRSRSPRRAGSPDWTTHRGKTTWEMVEELRAQQRERAVCSSGKDYARKPIGFMSGLASKRDMGIAATRLREEETYVPKQVDSRKQETETEKTKKMLDDRDKQNQDREQQQRMQQLFEKYGTQKPAPEKAAPTDI